MMKKSDDRTGFSVGEILRRWGPAYSRTHPVPDHQRKAMRALAACRTSALGGHLEKCDACGFERPVYNSCGNRNCRSPAVTGSLPTSPRESARLVARALLGCPTCQGKLARKWLAARLDDLLNTP